MPINASVGEVVTIAAQDEVITPAVPERDFDQYKIMDLNVMTNPHTMVTSVTVRLRKMHVDGSNNEFLAPRESGDVIKQFGVSDVYELAATQPSIGIAIGALAAAIEEYGLANELI